MAHLLSVRVYFEDTDAGGIVYHGSYLRFAERARTELLRDAGVLHPALAAEHGVGLAVRRVEADFLRPAHLDDRLDVRTALASVGGASMTVDQIIVRNDEVLVRMRVLVACIDRHGRPARLPADVRTVLSDICRNVG